MQRGFGVFFLVGGLVLFVFAGVLIAKTESFRHRAAEVTGVVVENIDTPGTGRRRNTPTYRPRVKFTTSEGQAVDFVSGTGTNPPSYSEGEAVKVLYDPRDPEDAKIDGFWQLWMGRAFWGSLAGFGWCSEVG